MGQKGQEWMKNEKKNHDEENFATQKKRTERVQVYFFLLVPDSIRTQFFTAPK